MGNSIEKYDKLSIRYRSAVAAKNRSLISIRNSQYLKSQKNVAIF